MSAARRQRRHPLARMVGLARSGEARCILCNATAGNVGIWTPDPVTRRLFNTVDLASIVYALCHSCAALPNPSTRIEDQILADQASRQ